MAICIAGMHRSGTSMVTQLLHRCGLDLGPPSELLRPDAGNAEGFWENVHFVNLNDDVLARRGGRWDLPPPSYQGWENEPGLTDLRQKAAELVKPFAGSRTWGWKDPRNSLTYPFWRSVAPGAQLVICVRHPVEAARSLAERGGSADLSWIRLWLEYYRALLTTSVPVERIVTHYESYFLDPAGELMRLVRLLNIPESSEKIRQVAPRASPALRHQRFCFQDLLHPSSPPEVLKCYADLCAEAGPIFARCLESEPPVTVRPNALLRVVQSSFTDALERAQLSRQVTALITEHSRILDELRGQVVDRDRILNDIGAGPASNRTSLAWKFALGLRRIRQFLAPNGSWRERLVRRTLFAGASPHSNGKPHTNGRLSGARRAILHGLGRIK